MADIAAPISTPTVLAPSAQKSSSFAEARPITQTPTTDVTTGTKASTPDAPTQHAEPVQEATEQGQSFDEYRAAQKAYKAEKARYEREIAELKSRSTKYEPLDKYASEGDIMKVLEHFGYDYEKLTNKILEGQDPVQQKFKELEAKIEADKQERARQEKEIFTQRQQKMISEFKGRISDHLEQNKDKYELTHHYGATDGVYDVIKYIYDTEKVEISFDEACEKMEAYYESEIDKLSSVSKIKTRLGGQQQQSNVSNLQPNQIQYTSTDRQSSDGPKTLSDSRMTSTSQPNRPLESMSKEERFQLAVEIMRKAKSQAT